MTPPLAAVCGAASGGGGGDSSFAATNATATSSGTSTRTGVGQVTISFDPSTDSCANPAPVADRRRSAVHRVVVDRR